MEHAETSTPFLFSVSLNSSFNSKYCPHRFRLGFLDEVSGHAATNGFLALSLFNLEPLREHLEILKLRSNNMSAFPEQFSRRFSRLQQLDLSDNRFRSKLNSLFIHENYL